MEIADWSVPDELSGLTDRLSHKMFTVRFALPTESYKIGCKFPSKKTIQQNLNILKNVFSSFISLVVAFDLTANIK